MEKEYGKVTLDQFQRIIKGLREIRGQMKELSQAIKAAPREKIREILGQDFSWAKVYERPFVEQIELLFRALGRAKKLLEVSKADDPQEAALNWMDNDDMADWDGGEGGMFQRKDLIGLVVVLQRNILSIMLYHRTLAVLVEEVRGGSDTSFFLAVRVDRSILSCRTFADRLARAELENDKDFFLHLRSALKGPSRKYMEALKDLRYALAMLREFGFDQLSDAQLEDLLVNKLKLYPKVPSARKNLRKQLYESKKIRTF